MAAHDRDRRDAEARRARAEAAITHAEGRIAAADRDLASLAERERAAGDERDTVGTELAAARAREAAARETMEALLADDRAERTRLAEAERAAMSARERLRAADDRARAADVAAVEARLGLDALREQVLVELAGLGDTGLRHLAAAAGLEQGGLDGDAVGSPRPSDAGEGADEEAVADTSLESAALEAALDVLAPRWAVEPPITEAPSPGRLAVLRRRFHELERPTRSRSTSIAPSGSGSSRSMPRTATCARRSPRRGP